MQSGRVNGDRQNIGGQQQGLSLFPFHFYFLVPPLFFRFFPTSFHSSLSFFLCQLVFHALVHFVSFSLFFFFFKLRIGLHKPTHAFRIDPRVNRRETYIHTRMYIIYIQRERKRRESEHDKLKSEVLENNRAVVFSRRTRPLHLLEHRAEIFHLYPPPAL